MSVVRAREQQPHMLQALLNYLTALSVQSSRFWIQAEDNRTQRVPEITHELEPAPSENLRAPKILKT